MGDLSAVIETSSSIEQAEPRIGGRFKGALRFDGHLYAHATVSGFSNRAAHTVAFWVRIPSDTPIDNSAPIVAWMTTAQEPSRAQPVEISLNTAPAQGPVGALRTEIGRITIIGTTNLRDGQWHHLAVVIVPRNIGKQRWHVRQYVDGRLEEGTAKVAKKGRADAVDGPADDIVWLGCEAGKTSPDQKMFRGELDELFIADRALPPSQIDELFKENIGP